MLTIRHPALCILLLWVAVAAMLSGCDAVKPSIPTCDNPEVKQTVINLLNQRQREEAANRTGMQKLLGIGAESIGTRFLSLENPKELHGDKVIRGCVATPNTNVPSSQVLEVGYTIESNGAEGGFIVQIHHPDELHTTFKVADPVQVIASQPASTPASSASEELKSAKAEQDALVGEVPAVLLNGKIYDGIARRTLTESGYERFSKLLSVPFDGINGFNKEKDGVISGMGCEWKNCDASSLGFFAIDRKTGTLFIGYAENGSIHCFGAGSPKLYPKPMDEWCTPGPQPSNPQEPTPPPHDGASPPK